MSTEEDPRNIVRMSVRPPARYAVGADFALWSVRFELYAKEARIPEARWTKELLQLLEDEPFRTVSQLGLLDSTDYKQVRDCLQQRFAPKGNELEWQFRLQSRNQKASEPLVEFAGELRMLADKAYPNWSADQRQEVVRNQFIQGVNSPSIQLQLMREMPATLDLALELARCLESVELAQRRLHREKRGAEALSVTDPAEEDEPSQANALRRYDSRRTERQIEELSRQVRRLTEEVARLQDGSVDGQPQKKGPVCWGCRERGHIKRNCPHTQKGPRERRQHDNRRQQPPLN